MILEIADIHIKSGKNADFESAIRTALATVFPKAKGFVSHYFHACVESSDRYVLQLTWESLEDHPVEFRGSALFAEWRALVGSFFAQAPHLKHFKQVSASGIT
jgi:heme-degrading monooxygenase HmoA